MKHSFKIGDHIKEKSFRLKKRIGEILNIREDSKTNPTFECMLVHHKTLEPIEDAFGGHKIFNIKKDKCKYYIPRNKLFAKKPFDISSYISYKNKYGRIICYLNREDGLYPHSYDMRRHNGKDLLECIEVKPVGLARVTYDSGDPKIFIADPSNSKVVDVIIDEEDGKTKLKVDKS